MNPAEIDEAILAVVEPSWKKMAMIIVRVSNRLPDLPQEEASYDIIAQRIGVLVDKGRLLAAGDISRWRFSEIKLP